MVILYVIVALLVGVVIGNVMGVILSHEIVTRSSVFFKELVLRGDAAMAMLKRTGDELERLGQGKKVVLASDLQAAKQAIDVGYSKRVEPAQKA